MVTVSMQRHYANYAIKASIYGVTFLTWRHATLRRDVSSVTSRYLRCDVITESTLYLVSLIPESWIFAFFSQKKNDRLTFDYHGNHSAIFPSLGSEAAWVCIFHQSLYFHGNRSKLFTSVYAMTLSDPPGITVSSFVKIGPETAEEIENKGKKCPNLPASVLSCFMVWWRINFPWLTINKYDM